MLSPLARPTDKLGPKKVLQGVLMLWTAAGLTAYFIQSQTSFYILALVAGFGLGSVQSASRAFMASLVPDGREAEMFGFYAPVRQIVLGAGAVALRGHGLSCQR